MGGWKGGRQREKGEQEESGRRGEKGIAEGGNTASDDGAKMLLNTGNSWEK